MDSNRFDDLTRLFGAGVNRRRVLRGLLGGAGALAVAGTSRQLVGAACDPNEGDVTCPPGTFHAGLSKKPPGGCCNGNGNCCSNVCTDGTCVDALPPECEVDDDCQSPDSCTVVGCVEGSCEVVEGGCPDGEYCCPAQGGSCAPCCTDADCPAGTPICYIPGDPTNAYCVQCVDAGDCGPCEACEGNQCVPTGKEYCEEGDYCYSKSTGGCCTSDECGCGECVDRQCTAPECCHDSDCGECEICHDGFCGGACSQSEECCNGDCVPFDTCCKEFGDYCGVLEVSSAGGAEQLDCCDGLLCCWAEGGNVCAECCDDHDCGKDGVCRHGYCEYPQECTSDKECPEHTCCCKDGNCSHKCCNHHPKPPKPPAPQPPAPAPVTTLPATGAGNDQGNDSSALGITLAAGAAALLAAKTLRRTADEATDEI